MDTDRKLVVVHIDGKLASISTDYRKLAEISMLQPDAKAGMRIKKADTKGKTAIMKRTNMLPFQEITARTMTFDEVWDLKSRTCWDDLMLFGTEFQRNVWHRLWLLSHPEEGSTQEDCQGNPWLLSYSDFAGLCGNKAGVRPVAHAVALNPIPLIIPCHLVVPKEAIDKMDFIQKKAESTIFRGDDLCIESILGDHSIDFGEYALGRDLKRKLIMKELSPAE